MNRSPLALAVLAVLAFSLGGGALTFNAYAQKPAGTGKPGPTAAPVPETPPPTVPTLAGFLERQIKWGMTHAEVTDVYNSQQGLFEKDYAPLLARSQPGVAMDNVRAEMNSKKAAFAASWVPFLDTPNGYDSLPIRNEYTYKNNEALQKVQRNGRVRYLFYFSDKLWKIYEDFPLKSDAALGASYQEAVTKLNTALGVAGRVRQADPAAGLERMTTDWQDANSRMRAVERGSNVIGLVLEERATLNRLDSLRSNKAVDVTQIDPSISAVTKHGVSDPNAAQPGASASASGKPGQKPPPKR